MRRIDAGRESPERIADEAAAVVHAGGTLIFPTDTVYGIGADPAWPDAVRQIYRSKGRSSAKPLCLHLATVAELLEYVAGNVLATLAARRLLPGPVTIIVPRPAFVSQDITSGLPTLGLRVPEHPICSAILDRTGPLAATSANPSGQEAYSGSNGGELPPADLFVDAGPTPMGAESTIIDLSGAAPRILRLGALPLERIVAALGPVDLPFQTRINAQE